MAVMAPTRARRDRRDQPRHAVGGPRDGPRRRSVAEGVRRTGGGLGGRRHHVRRSGRRTHGRRVRVVRRLHDRAGVRRLPHAPAVRRVARGRVRGASVGGLVPRAARRGRDLPERADARRGERRRGARVLPFARAGDGRARHDGPRAQDRLRPLRRGRAPSGSPRPPARAGGAADLFGHAARVPRGARGDAARRLGPNGVRRADPGRGERGPGRRGRRLRRGHRVHGRRPRRGRAVPPRRPDCRSAATPTSWGPRAPPRPRSRSGRGARTT